LFFASLASLMPASFAVNIFSSESSESSWNDSGSDAGSLAALAGPEDELAGAVAARLAAFCRCRLRLALLGPPASSSAKTFLTPVSKASFFWARSDMTSSMLTLIHSLVRGGVPFGGGGTAPLQAGSSPVVLHAAAIAAAFGFGGTAAHEVLDAPGPIDAPGPAGSEPQGGMSCPLLPFDISKAFFCMPGMKAGCMATN
jgi:hypothetical protein